MRKRVRENEKYTTGKEINNSNYQPIEYTSKRVLRGCINQISYSGNSQGSPGRTKIVVFCDNCQQERILSSTSGRGFGIVRKGHGFTNISSYLDVLDMHNTNDLDIIKGYELVRPKIFCFTCFEEKAPPCFLCHKRANGNDLFECYICKKYFCESHVNMHHPVFISKKLLNGIINNPYYINNSSHNSPSTLSWEFQYAIIPYVCNLDNDMIKLLLLTTNNTVRSFTGFTDYKILDI